MSKTALSINVCATDWTDEISTISCNDFMYETFTLSKNELEGEFCFFDLCRCSMGSLNWILQEPIRK